MNIDKQLWLDAYKAELQRNPDINVSAQYADAAMHEYRKRFCWRQVAICCVLSPVIAMGSAVAICVMCGQWTVSIVPAALTACAFMSMGFVAGAAYVISEGNR